MFNAGNIGIVNGKKVKKHKCLLTFFCFLWKFLFFIGYPCHFGKLSDRMVWSLNLSKRLSKRLPKACRRPAYFLSRTFFAASTMCGASIP